MITSRNPTRLSDPNSGEPISGLDFAYIKARTRSEAFSTVHREFDNSGISQAELATRMKKDQGRLSKMLGAPGNWTLDTVAELLWAISGARVKFVGQKDRAGMTPETVIKAAYDLIAAIQRDDTGTMVGKSWVGGNGGMLSRDTLAAADRLRMALDAVRSKG